MIQLMEKIIKEKLGGRVGRVDLPLRFLKFSTAGSGRGAYNKVIFLVFKNNAKEPFVCVKTVRQYSDRHTISNAFCNLSELNKLVQGSTYEEMFPGALYLYDDGHYTIFSVETACPGIRADNNRKTLRSILDQYFDFQKYLSDKASGSICDLYQYGLDVIKELDFTKGDQQEISDYFKNLFRRGNVRGVKTVPQHGDLTLDNIFLKNKKIGVVDCDFFGVIKLAGFDVFHLLARCNNNGFVKYYKEYFREYFDAIGESISVEPHVIFLYCLHDFVFKRSKSLKYLSTKTIIDYFEKFLINHGT